MFAVFEAPSGTVYDAVAVAKREGGAGTKKEADTVAKGDADVVVSVVVL